MKRKLLITTLMISIFLNWGPAKAATLRVPQQYSSLESALVNVQTGDVILVEPGVYYEAGLILSQGISIVGAGSHPYEVIIDAEHLDRIMLAEGLQGETVIENMTFRHGKASGATSYDQSGGAIFCSNSMLRITNCKFLENEADSHGGAIRCNNSSPEILDCFFSGNSAPSGGGGAVDCSYGAYPLLVNCTFMNNMADWGGALSCRADSSPKINSSTFDRNEALGDRSFGGAIFADYEAKPTISQSVFCDNIAIYGGGAACFENAEINMSNCTMAGNESQVDGGALYLRGSSPLITGTIIAFNTGTAIATDASADPQISCTDIYGNSLGDWDGSFSDQQFSDGNIAVDPLFCSVVPGTEGRFFLDENSPLVQTDSDCTIMGAMPIGCVSISDAGPLPDLKVMGPVSAYPNPFNPATVIQFELGQVQHVRVNVFNLQGSLVRTLSDEELDSGRHRLRWNGKDDTGRIVGSGAYIVVVESALGRHTKKLTMLK